MQIDKNAEFMVSGIITAGDRRLGARSGTGKKVVELAKMCVALACQHTRTRTQPSVSIGALRMLA